jgi:hypothetical protein
MAKSTSLATVYRQIDTRPFRPERRRGAYACNCGFKSFDRDAYGDHFTLPPHLLWKDLLIENMSPDMLETLARKLVSKDMHRGARKRKIRLVR